MRGNSKFKGGGERSSGFGVRRKKGKIGKAGEIAESSKLKAESEGKKLSGFFRAHRTALNAEGMVFGQDVPVFIHTIPGGGQGNTAGGMPAGALSGFGFRLLIQLDAVLVQAGIGSGCGPSDHVAGGHPGGTGGQFVFSISKTSVQSRSAR